MIAIIDYNAGNTYSVMSALKRLNLEFQLTDNANEIQKADRVIFPGVGHAEMAMETLQRKSLVGVIKSLEQPVLGICLGMQLFCTRSEEGNTTCLGIIPETCKLFDFDKDDEFKKVPHMGWNTIQNLAHPLFVGVPENTHMYFVHSYYVPENENGIACTQYNHSFCASMQKDNFYGVQFHPEKSGKWGEMILQNFTRI